MRRLLFVGVLLVSVKLLSQHFLASSHPGFVFNLAVPFLQSRLHRRFKLLILPQASSLALERTLVRFLEGPQDFIVAARLQRSYVDGCPR